MATRWPQFLGDMRSHQASILEWSQLNGQAISYLRLDRRSTELLDDLHNEVLESSLVFMPAVELFTQLELSPEQQLLTLYGLDEQRDVIIRPAVIACADAGLATYPEGDVTKEPEIFLLPGDRFVWDGDVFKTKEVWRDKRWANSTRPLYLMITANRDTDITLQIDCTD